MAAMDARSILIALGPGGLEKIRTKLQQAKESLEQKKQLYHELVQSNAEKREKLDKTIEELVDVRCETIILRNLNSSYKARLENQRVEFAEAKKALYVNHAIRKQAIQQRIDAKEKKLAKLRAFEYDALAAELEAKRRKDQYLKAQVKIALKDKEDAIREEEENRRRNDALLEAEEKKFEEAKQDVYKMVVAANIVRSRQMEIEKGGSFTKKQQK